jgi:polyhydroxybutyrate depolymerase
MQRWILAVAFLLACGDDDAAPLVPVDSGTATIDGAPDSADAAPPTADAGPRPTVFGGDRPATLIVPESYDPATPTPLVVVLHGYAPTNSYAAGLLGIDAAQAAAGFLMISPSGSKNPSGDYYWNATDACCDFYSANVDDVAYLTGLIDDIAAAYNVDAKRVFVVGHSNGGFMAYRLACESAGRVAAIVSVAGATFADAAACVPAAEVNVLQIHGTSDGTISYEGGALSNGGPLYPAATTSVATWAGYNGCAATSTAGASVDVVGEATAETTTIIHDACPAGGTAELWTVVGGPHVMLIKPAQPLIWTWLAAHPRP